MALERDFELLDDYLANRLSAGERAAVEQKIASDPELKRELSIQQQVVEGLRKARMAELKQMLSNTPIPPVGGQALLAKLGVAAVVAGVIGTGFYFLLKDNSTAPVKQPVPQAQQEPAATPEEQQPAAAATDKDTQATAQPAGPKPAAKATEKPGASVDTSAQPARQPQKPEAFDPTAEETTSSSAPSADALIINGAAVSAEESSLSIENVIDKRYTFHYQFKDGKLLLYGPFSDKSTYEILEFFTDNKRTTAVLFYKNNYHALREENDKIAPLKPITDPALINKLKEYRKKN